MEAGSLNSSLLPRLLQPSPARRRNTFDGQPPVALGVLWHKGRTALAAASEAWAWFYRRYRSHNKIDIIFDIQKLIEEHFAPVLLLLRRLRFGYPFRKIPLTKGKFAIVDPEDYSRLRKYKWHAHNSRHTYYAVHSLTNGRTAPRKNLHMHNLIIHIPPGSYCDHINHNGLDNRKANVRPATHTQNVWHRRKFNRPTRSKYKGVDWVEATQRWRARIRVNGKRIYLGSFKYEIDAAKAYDRAARKFHGKFAALNFPDQ